MSQVTNLAFFRARRGQSEALGAALAALVEPTQLEAECLNHARHHVGWADFARSSDAPRNEGCDRWSERRCRPAGPGQDDVDLQNETAGYHSMVT